MNLEQDQIYTVEKDGNGRTYAVDTGQGEVFLPSVTTIINFVVNKPALPPWAYNVGIKSTLNYLRTHERDVLDKGWPNEGVVKLGIEEMAASHKDEMKAGAERGVEVHSVLEAIANDEDYTFSVGYKPYVDTLLKWIDDYDPEWHHSEFKVASLNHNYAGQFDGICTIRKHPPRRRHESLVGKRVLLDIKTNGAGAVYPETHLPQVEGYANAYLEMGGKGVDAKLVVGIGPDGKYTPCVSYARFKTFEKILDLYNELQWMKDQNPNKRK